MRMTSLARPAAVGIRASPALAADADGFSGGRRWFLGAGLCALATPGSANATPTEGGRRPVVVLDPGHGGRDSGAVGPTGLLEKDVTLHVALKLRALLERDDVCDVHLTRDEDVFVPLVERLRMTQTMRAHVLISLHADALSDRRVRGASVYTLSPNASDGLAAELAQRENREAATGRRSFDEYPPEVSVILESLIFREKRVFSARMQGTVIDMLRSRIDLLAEPARQANFLILRSGSVPSVLLEMGFISNGEDERLLRSVPYRETVALAIGEAIHVRAAQFAEAGD